MPNRTKNPIKYPQTLSGFRRPPDDCPFALMACHGLFPDKSDRLPVILYNAEWKERKDVKVFAHRPRSSDTDVKCDLHPRWSRDERMVAVDTCEAGFRQIMILDVSDIVR